LPAELLLPLALVFFVALAADRFFVAGADFDLEAFLEVRVFLSEVKEAW